MTRRAWTPLEEGQLRRLYPDLPSKDLARFFCRKLEVIYAKARNLRLRKSAAYLASPHACRLRRGDQVGIAHRFGPGHPSYRWNAGKKIGSRGRSAETQFKPGQISNTWVPIGTVVVDTEGYRKIKVSDDHTVPSRFNWRFCHVLLWERHRGPVPRGHVVTFRDGNRAHLRIRNLELISRRELRRRNSIHALPPELKGVILQLAGLKRRITNKERKLRHAENENAGRPTRDPLQRRRAPGSGDRSGEARRRAEAVQGGGRTGQGAHRDRQARSRALEGDRRPPGR